MYNHAKIEDRALLMKQTELFVSDARSAVSLLANMSALLMQYYNQANWLGFYLAQDDYLYLGPFQGKSACQYIPWGKGVCGTAALEKKTQIVADVRKLTNHITCSAESISEIVVPIIINDRVYGVLDIDAPLVGYFNETDKELLEEIITIIASKLTT